MKRVAIAVGFVSVLIGVALALMNSGDALSQNQLPPPGNLRFVATTYQPVGVAIIPNSAISHSWYVANDGAGAIYPVFCGITYPDQTGPKIICYRGAFPK